MRVYVAGVIFWGLMVGAAAHAEEVRFPAEVVRADFKVLYQNLQEAHFNLFVNITKAEMDRAFETQLAAITQPMTEDEARIAFQRFVALAKIAHTHINLPVATFIRFLEAGGLVFPLDIKMVGDQVLVTANDSGLAAVSAGSRIVAINGVPMTQWSHRLGAYLSADTQTMLHGLFEFQFAFLLWLELGELPHFQITLAAGKTTVTHSVPARDRAFMRAEREKRSGRLALDGGRSFRMEPGKVGYLRPGPFYNIAGDNLWDEAPFRSFIDEAFSTFAQQSAKALVIDLRDNPGGTNGFSDYMLAYFAHKPFRFASRFTVKVSTQTTASNAKRLSPDDPDNTTARYARAFAQRKPGDRFEFEIDEAQPRQGTRFEKPVFLLINRHSYSNGVFVAAIVQDYGFGTVIGEETNDLATTYGAVEQFSLPNTKIEVVYPKAHMIRPNGDTTIRGVVPDIALETPLLENDKDPVLQQTLAVITKQIAKPAKK